MLFCKTVCKMFVIIKQDKCHKFYFIWIFKISMYKLHLLFCMYLTSFNMCFFSVIFAKAYAKHASRIKETANVQISL